MEANRGRSRWTWAEYARLPSEGGPRHEVIDGALVVTPAPALRHQRIATDLVTLLNTFVRSHDLGEVFAGPVDVLFGDGDYLQPDLVFVGKERSHLLSDRGVEGPPDLVVEIASPSTAERDCGIKLERYRLFGVAEYWVVDPDARTVEVWKLADGAEEPQVLAAFDSLVWRLAGTTATLEVEVRRIVG
jgi:Uma2 family endonuclease